MAHKQLLQLLKEDQQPFHLKTYISEKRCQLKPPNPITRNFSDHSGFLPFHHHQSPHISNSPFQDFPSPVLLPIPASLLEAAIRIQKKQGSPENRAHIKDLGSGLLGSILNKLKHRNNNKREELGNSSTSQNGKTEDQSSDQKLFSCNCNNHNSSRLSITGWSECFNENSIDSLDEAFTGYEEHFSSITLSPFSLQTSPSSANGSPVLSSHASSPNFPNKEKPESAEKSNNEGESSEQCSPVSVLDTPFEDDHVAGHKDPNIDSYDEDDDYLDCSFAVVQEAKEQLLDKLWRFEKLAELDPVELEKRMMVGEDDSHDEQISLGRDDDLDTHMRIQVLSLSSFKQPRKLVSDLIEEENDDKYVGYNKNKEVMIRRLWRRLSSWKEVEANEMYSVIKLDSERDFDGSKMNVEEYVEIVKEIEVAVFRVLMEEVTTEITGM